MEPDWAEVAAFVGVAEEGVVGHTEVVVAGYVAKYQNNFDE